MEQTTTRTERRATPDRWQAALRRAVAEGVEVRQLAGSGAWIATSGTDDTAAYMVGADACECQAHEFGDPICKHKAKYWNAVGVLDLDPEPSAPVRRVPGACGTCNGDGFLRKASATFVGRYYRVTCPACWGSKRVAA